jgi:chromosome segregation ATPase
MKQQMLEAEVKELKARIEALKAELEAAKEAYDDIDQYARRHCAEVETLTAERDAAKQSEANAWVQWNAMQDVLGKSKELEFAFDEVAALKADNAQLREAAKDVDGLMRGNKAYERSGYGPKLRAALNHGKETE